MMIAEPRGKKGMFPACFGSVHDDRRHGDACDDPCAEV